MKPLAVAAWSMITPFGEDDATIDALFEQRSAFSPQASHWKLRNTLAAVVPERPSQAARDSQWQRYLATYVTRKVLDTLSIDIQKSQDRCAFVFATNKPLMETVLANFNGAGVEKTLADTLDYWRMVVKKEQAGLV